MRGKLVEPTSVVDVPIVVPVSEAQIMSSTDIVRRATHASKALMVRQALVYTSNILGSVVLARLLSPKDFGFYGIVLFAIAFLGVFGGTGFAANLIRMEEEPTEVDKRVIFTAQQILVATLFLAILFLAPWLASRYALTSHGAAFFCMIGGALVLTSFMVMPQIRMERELAFDKLAVVEVSQAIAFNVSAVLLAWKGFGALSFASALLVRSGIGAVLAQCMAPWRMGVQWDLPTLKRHLHFGIALQAGQLVGMVKDSISPLFVGMFLGAADVGYVTWASSLAAYAVWILMPMQRLYLPFFARLQNDLFELRRAVSFALWMANIIAAPVTLVTLALSRPITALIFGSKWFVALPLFYLFCIGNLFVPCSTPLMGLLNALGRSRKTLLMSLIWMLTTWLLGIPAIYLYGLIGFGIAMIGVQLTNLVLFWMVWREISVGPLSAYWPAWPLAGATGLILYFIQKAAPARNVAMLVCYGVAGLLAYASVLWFLYPSRIRGIVRMVGRTA